MLDIRVIANYFGAPPRIFPLWLDSCGANLDIQWMFITDIDMSCYTLPSNMTVINTNFGKLKEVLQAKFPYPVRYERPWDFCAFKPLLGTIFEDELQGADYWGWSDCDMLYGDLTPVVKLAEQGYDKIMPNGHFSIIRNTPELNKFIFNHPCTRKAVAVDENGLSCYDERDFRFTVMHDYGAKQASEIVPYIHLYPRWGHFKFNVSKAASRLLGLGEDGSCPVVFTWQSGKLTGHFALPNHSVQTLDLAYVHFFKRNIGIKTDNLKTDGTVYLIKPCGVAKLCDPGASFEGLSYAKILLLNFPRLHWKYIKDRLNLATAKRKLRRLFRGLRKQKVQQNDTIVFHSDC